MPTLLSLFWLLLASAVAEVPCLQLSHTPAAVAKLTGVGETRSTPPGTTLPEVRADTSATWSPLPNIFTKPPGAAETWLRACVSNDTPNHEERVLLVDSRLIDHVDAWRAINGELVGWSLGEDSSVASRPILVPSVAIPLPLPPGGRAEVWLRMVDEGSITAPVVLIESAALARREGQHQLMWGAILAMMTVCLALGVGAWLRLKDEVAGWFALMMVGSLGYIAFVKWGDVGLFFPPEARPFWSNRLILVFALTGVTGFGEYLSALLRLPERNEQADRWLRNARWFLLVAWPLTLPFSFTWQTRFTLLCNFPILAVMAWSIVLAYQGVREARLYTIALLTAISTYILGSLQTLGLVEATLMSQHGIAASLVILDIFLGILAIDHVAEQRRGREAALTERLAAVERNARLSTVFEQFVPKQFLDRLGGTAITDVTLGMGVQAEMTVLFSDIRGFTTLVERMTPEENFRFINRYLSYMEAPVHDAGGFIDKYIGDAVMALFDEGKDAGADAGVAAAVGMHRALAAYNAERHEDGQAPVRIGIGLHTGPLMLGTIGGRDRLNASVIGDAVNLAARVEGMTKGYQARLLVTAATADRLTPERFTLRTVDRVQVKGKTQPVTVYEVVDADTAEVRAVKKALLGRWQAGWTAFYDRRFGDAAEAFGDCISEHDPLAAQLSDRSKSLAETGVGDDWDGVLALSWK